ncbi:excinuclease ABC subunit UvrA [Patescibacteria group bacterium]|nr:excinuclease ABC subunit UvrA [Patescibacteria group bacterium]
MNKHIIINGARVHNLKNISLKIPRNKLVVITGLSGSGKSSLAFDTIYAEGQRRYVESLSAYARQFIGLMDKPDVDSIEGLSPAISIDQKSTSHNPRSTVGTVTEIYDYLRLLFARVGVPHCPKCGSVIQKHSIDEIEDSIVKTFENKNILILSPLVKDRKGEHRSVLENVQKAGFSHVRLDRKVVTLGDAFEVKLSKTHKHSIEMVIDNLNVTSDKEDLSRLFEGIERALDYSNGSIIVQEVGQESAKNKEILYSQAFACVKCDISLPEIEPRSFSFNSPHGACMSCTGLGIKREIDPELILNKNLTIAQGAIKPWSRSAGHSQVWMMRILGMVASRYNFDLNTPLDSLSEEQMKIILHGTGGESFDVDYVSSRFTGELSTEFEGVIPNLERRYKQTESDHVRREVDGYMRELICPSCNGARLKKEILAVRVGSYSINDLTIASIGEAKDIFTNFSKRHTLTKSQQQISVPIMREINTRLNFLSNVGLNYLTLSRAANTLSGGEAQRIRLTTQIGSALMGVLYILDEPSIGLHQRDNQKLIHTLEELRDLGNTVIIVEHDRDTMLASDWIVDIGPGAGEHGGCIVAEGTAKDIKNNRKSITGKYLSYKKQIQTNREPRKGSGAFLTINKASEHNLKDITVSFPLGKFIAITGVSGSGKSTLMTDILARALNQKFYHAKAIPGKHESIDGISFLDKIIDINQSPIGRTPRSNPATYTGAFTPIRELFASLPESKILGYKAGRFSFNVTGGRCEACSGDGLVKIEMQFLPNVYVDCEVCKGARYNKEALEIHYKGHTIADVLNLTVEDALTLFKKIPAIADKLLTLEQVGLGYIKLGQSATTLSGGEAQRIKLSTELSRRSTGRTLYILDEPTTGLHFEDIKRLLGILNKLVDKGNTVLIIEHNIDVIKSVDWIIDLGPEGGAGGGQIVAEGTAEDVAQVEESWTGRFLKNEM